MFSKYFVFVLAGLGMLYSCGRGGEDKSSRELLSESVGPVELYGELLAAVREQEIFSDEKTFLDCMPRATPVEIMERFQSAKDSAGFNLKAFVGEYFDPPWRPSRASFADSLPAPEAFIRSSWAVARRQPEQSGAGSLLSLPQPYIVSGGSFRELHYWDSYFIMLGLQADNEAGQMQALLDNLAYLIDSYGYIPSGNRTYYLGRTNPPVFAGMVEMLATEIGDAVYRRYLSQLEKEYEFWMKGSDRLSVDTPAVRRVVRLSDKAILNRYWNERTEPRPENHALDYNLAKESGEGTEAIYRNLLAGAESGWGNASRWRTDPQSPNSIRTTKLVPVDLNALMYHLENVLVKANQLAENVERVAELLRAANARKEAMLKYCWDPELGFFTDFDFEHFSSAGVATLAGIYPLCFNIATHEQGKACALRVRDWFLQPGGVVTSLNKTGEFWDAPYGWASLQWMTIQGLRNYGEVELADELKSRWLRYNVRMYEEYGQLFDRYNVVDTGIVVSMTQFPAGFGGTNGVLLKLLRE